MGIFKKPEEKATIPEEEEKPEEIEYIEDLSKNKKETPTKKKVKKVEEQIREVPVCLSQAQINNLIIENNIILKQIISNNEV